MPGAGKQPPEIQNQIKTLLEAGFDPTTIHRRLKVGRSSIYRMKRSLQQHGTPYMPPELNKKNGRPKVLTAEQEIEVRDWLRDPKNRGRYLDDLVWLIHDRFGVVCSTTTMSKLKRKWLRVIECEESGEALDEGTRAWVMETHPHLAILHDRRGGGAGAGAGAVAEGVQQGRRMGDGNQSQDGAEGQRHSIQYPRHHLALATDPQLDHTAAGALDHHLRDHPPMHDSFEPQMSGGMERTADMTHV